MVEADLSFSSCWTTRGAVIVEVVVVQERDILGDIMAIDERGWGHNTRMVDQKVVN